MVHPDDYEDISSSIVRQVDERNDDSDHIEYRIIRKDGEVRWIDDYGHYVESDVYKGIYYVFISDVTEKRLQAESDKATRSAVIEALSRVYNSVWLVDDIENERFTLYRIDGHDGKEHLEVASEALKKLTYTQAMGYYADSVIYPDDRERFKKDTALERVIENTDNKLIYSVGFKRVFEDAVRYYCVEFAGIELLGGKTGIVLGFKDVDEEVRKEMDIRQALTDAIDAANASNKAKSKFLSSMSHDIRTPMNGIIGMTAIAATHIDDKELVADCLKKITDSSEHLLALINEVLDMNKIESGKVELQEEAFNLADLIDNMINMTRPQLLDREHQFKVNVINVKNELVIGDSRRIQQVFVNIMSNAIKYTPNGGKISLSINERPTRAHGIGHYEFIFEDNGIGMTEEFQKHIFEPFTRSGDKNVSSIQGTGLGMAISRNIVRMMGGDISVESRYGEGSKFTVNIYLKLQNSVDIDYTRFADLHVLVADDDPLSCETTCEILNDLGMNSEWVLSGRSAVERVKIRHEQERDFYAVIIDWKMPDMDGVETTRRIRELVGNDIPIIVFSAYDWTDIEYEAREAGVDLFISKPLFKSKLVNLFNMMVTSSTDYETSMKPLKKIEDLDLTGHRILLAEDNLINAEIAKNILQMTGLEVEWVEDGQEAADRMNDVPDGYYDLIFMDIQMPKLNGYEATGNIRDSEREYLKKVPIIAMTANAFADDVVQAKNAGMNEHIAKPLDFEELAKILQTFIE